MPKANRSGNGNRLFNDLRNRVRKCVEKYEAEGRKGEDLYDYCLATDKSLLRKKKHAIEEALNSVLESKSQQAGEASSSDEDAVAEYALVSRKLQHTWISQYIPPSSITNIASSSFKPTQETISLNKSVTNLWNLNKTPASSCAASPSVSGTSTPVAPSTPAVETLDDTVVNQKKRPKTSRDGNVSSKRNKSNHGTSSKELPFIPTAKLTDLGGIDQCIEEIMELIAMPLAHPEVYLHTGVQPPRGVLLHGPPGCGKTKLAHAIAGELGVPFFNISAPSIVSGMSGESEKKIREVFEEASENAPCLLFIDEIDAITPKRETAQREMERRIVAQLLTCMDDLSWEKLNNKPVMIIGATNRPDSLDPALRRAGRFDREISMGVPDEKAREKILSVLAAKLRLSGNFDFAELARATPGYVGADLQALITTAGVIAVKRIFKHLQEVVFKEQAPQSTDVAGEMKDNINQHQTFLDTDVTMEDQNEPQVEQPVPTTSVEEFESQSAVEQIRSISELIKHRQPLSEAQLESLSITHEDFEHALKKVQPSSKREGFATVPDVSWDDIGALQYVRDELRMAVVEPINHPDFFERVGITNPAGVLLWGPPGCGKTLLAKAVANESNTNFISVKGPELLNKYVGESERGVRQVFARARASAPCVIFFDELDALCSRRDDQQTDASARVVNTLLTELDGVENRSQVYVIAATNRPDMIDPAMLRPGRLDKLLYVELPSPAERLDILTKLSKKTPLSDDVSLADIANDSRCEGFSGADLASLVRESAVAALRTRFFTSGVVNMEAATNTDAIFVTKKDFDTAFTKVSPSVLPQDKAAFDRLRKKFG
ncbi:P-loop containing nucleoside triphosphate hydrolase protein [Mycotypha africana]|uniref:P-loop containing nucleoside triphosphate hydrolase protein n=1 Tax=Mycotypha africana TaxID=64632 RepID=UPI002300046A|nr:P-loop containing nucleoside triphosphate hydrolase protein [Mycotypha africana]KAI8967546.1 P-loop containing nucleoside triphosphate hydrolase protein [Mycotypha africana]